MCVADVGIFTNLVFVAGLGTCSMRVRVRLQDIAYNNIRMVRWRRRRASFTILFSGACRGDRIYNNNIVYNIILCTV